jgi:branched-chain amino acid transport system ATP-binding protein
MTVASAPLLEVHDLCVTFGDLRAVDGVSLDVRQGEIVGVIGPNGAGKSTLVNTIFGFHAPVAGRVVARGRDLARLSPDRRAALGFARTFQNLELFDSMTVFENVLVHVEASLRNRRTLGRRRIGGAERAGKHQRVRSMLAAVDLMPLANRPVSELSYAQRKLVEFARAMVADVQLVLLDEPTAGVALEERREVIARMHEHMRERGVAAIIVEHDMKVIKTLSARVYVLDGGKLISTGAFEDVVSDPRVREAYLG